MLRKFERGEWIMKPNGDVIKLTRATLNSTYLDTVTKIDNDIGKYLNAVLKLSLQEQIADL